MKNNIELQKFQYGLLVATPDDVQRTKNIGDYIQSIASAQFYPYVDELVHRETISSFVPKEKGIVKCIMNAWWMWNPQNWPPSDFLEALPISMHLSPIHAEELLAGEGLAWFKRNQPIGCRDYATKELFEKHGVSAYFSGCLTLTLGKSYRNMNPQGQNRVCFVDPYLHRDESKKRFLIYFHLFKAPYTILTLSRKDFFSTRWNNGVRNKNWLKNLLFATEFHKVYSSMFSNDVLRSAEYITHTIELDKDNDETLLRKAHILLQKYSTSRIVVTSRIHAGLPCLGMGTPVIFVTHEDLEGLNWNGGRLAGLLELFRKMELSGTKLVPKDNCFNFMGKIRKNSNFVNRDDWRKLSQNLSEACEDFVNGTKKKGGAKISR